MLVVHQGGPDGQWNGGWSDGYTYTMVNNDIFLVSAYQSIFMLMISMAERSACVIYLHVGLSGYLRAKSSARSPLQGVYMRFCQAHVEGVKRKRKAQVHVHTARDTS